jgi:hypothetical protein
MAGDAKPKTIVEIGSQCGKATFVLAAVAKAYSPRSRIVAVDTFDGVVGAPDRELLQRGPTLEKFKRMLRETELAPFVDIHMARARSISLNRPIDFVADRRSKRLRERRLRFSTPSMLTWNRVHLSHSMIMPSTFLACSGLSELLGSFEWLEVARAGRLVLRRRQVTSPAPVIAAHVDDPGESTLARCFVKFRDDRIAPWTPTKGRQKLSFS